MSCNDDGESLRADAAEDVDAGDGARGLDDIGGPVVGRQGQEKVSDPVGPLYYGVESESGNGGGVDGIDVA